MIRVLQVHGGMDKGGTESVIMNLYRNIDKNKIQFDFTTFKNEDCPYDEEIRKLGGQILRVKPRSEVGNIKHMISLYSVIKENNYKIVHSHMNFHGGIVALIAKLAGAEKVICHAHNTKDDGEGIKRKIEILILRKLILIFSNSLLACGYEAGQFVFGKKSEFEVISNSVDTNRFRPESKDNEDIRKMKVENKLNDKLILGHIGRFSEQKNHKFIISIIEELKEKNKNFKFILIGDGELKEEFFREIKAKNLNEYIVYLGLKDNINQWLNVIDIFILPSLFEGLPVVLVEAQATGVPCIISDNITKEVDLGLDLIKFISINNVISWVEQILINDKNKIIDQELIIKKMKEHGYIIKDNIEKISKIYQK